MQLSSPLNINLFTADKSITDSLETLPTSLKEAKELAQKSSLIRQYLPELI